MLTIALLALLQAQPVLAVAPQLQDCVWAGTSQSAVANWRIGMYTELKAIRATEPVFLQHRIFLFNGKKTTPEAPDLEYSVVLFARVITAGDVNHEFTSTEQSCLSYEARVLAA